MPTAYSIWPEGTIPQQPSDPETASVELGVRFGSATDGWVTGIRFYKSAGNTGTHTGTLWSSTGTALARTTFTSETSSGWQQAALATPVKVLKGEGYVASYRAPRGHYSADTDALSPANPTTRYALTATQGVYTYGATMPTSTWRNSNYYVDVVFTTQQPLPSATTSTSSSTTTTTTSSSSSSSTSPTSTTTSSGDCATVRVWTKLEACGWPGPTNTGFPAGQTFARTVTGGLTITADNTVIDGWKVTGGIAVRANNVTIRNSWVTNSRGGANGSGVVNVNPGYSATIERTLLDGLNATHSCIWHEGRAMTARAVNCQGVNDGVFMWTSQAGVDGTGDNFAIQDSYLHGFTTAAANGHVDGIQTEGAKNGVIRHNTVDVTQSQTSAIAIWNSRKSADNISVERNLMAGGGFTVYAEDYSPSEANPAGGYTVTNIRFTDNVFSKVHYGCVGSYGVWFLRGAPSDGWRRSGNVVLETGQRIDNGNPTNNGASCN